MILGSVRVFYLMRYYFTGNQKNCSYFASEAIRIGTRFYLVQQMEFYTSFRISFLNLHFLKKINRSNILRTVSPIWGTRTLNTFSHFNSEINRVSYSEFSEISCIGPQSKKTKTRILRNFF